MTIFLTACGGRGPLVTPEQMSEAARTQTTATGVELGSTQFGVPKRPTVEYIRTKMTQSIFLAPPEVDEPAVYVRVRDTTGRGLDLHGYVVEQIKAAGYKITPNAAKAVYTLNANVLVAKEVTALELTQLDETQYGQDVSGIVGATVAGALSGGLSGAQSGEALAGAVVGGLIGGLYRSSKSAKRKRAITAQQYTKFYSIVVDIELRERVKNGVVKRVGSASEGSGVSSLNVTEKAFSRQESETHTEESEWKRHRTRIHGRAKGKLIAFEDVRHDFAHRLAQSIAGLL